MSQADGAKPASALIARLTEAQLECLRLAQRRKTAKQIARSLNITHHAVEMRLKSARRNLGVTTTAEAIDILEAATAECYGLSVYGSSDIAELDLNWAPAALSPPSGGDSGKEVMTAFSPAADVFAAPPPRSGKIMEALLGDAGSMSWQQRLLFMAAMAFGAVTIVVLLISIIDGLSRLNPS